MSSIRDLGKGSARLAGQVALVTGGRGIGWEIALALAREGARVAVSARTSAEVEAVASAIQGAGDTALGIAADVTVWVDVQRIVDRTSADCPEKEDHRLVDNPPPRWSWAARD